MSKKQHNINYLLKLSQAYLLIVLGEKCFLILFLSLTLFNSGLVHSDEKENKSEQALQIIGHVVAKSYANKSSMHGRRQFLVSKFIK
jgi:hypothetical protein